MKKVLQESDWSLVSFWNLESLYFTYSHSFSFVFYHSLSLCHSFSLVVICFHSLYHLLSLVVPLLVTRCHSLYHPLSFVDTRYKTRCHSISLVVTHVPIVCLIINNQWFSANIAKHLRTAFSVEHLLWLLLKLVA